MPLAAEVLRTLRALPVDRVEWISNRQPILILAPHPDDETLGCGGVIAAAAASGVDVRVAVLTDGGGSHPGSLAYPRAALAALREAECAAAVAELGLVPGRVTSLGLPDAMATWRDPMVAGAIERLIELVVQHGIATLCSTWPHDPHRDHLLAHAVACEVAARTGTRHLSYPVWGWTLSPDHPLPEEPVTGRRIDITRFLPAKQRAIAAHASQLGRVVADDPGGFVLPESLLVNFAQPYEVFIEVPRPLIA